MLDENDRRIIEIPRLATMFGSDTDLEQGIAAHEFLLQTAKEKKVELLEEWTNSIHRNTLDVIAALSKLIGKVDAIIVGAGWANQLTGCVDALLRNTFKNDHILIIGVAIEDQDNPKHTQAAILSITELPGSSVVFHNFVGEEGCLRAAQYAAQGRYPLINLKEQKPPVCRSMEAALEIGRQQKLLRGRA